MWENTYLRIENPKATDSSFWLHDSTSLCQQLSASEARSPRQNPGSAPDHVQKWKIQYFWVEIFQHEDINQDTLIPLSFPVIHKVGNVAFLYYLNLKISRTEKLIYSQTLKT